MLTSDERLTCCSGLAGRSLVSSAALTIHGRRSMRFLEDHMVGLDFSTE